MEVRLGTWNIKAGRGAKGALLAREKTKYLDQIAQIIADERLDAVSLQEVDVQTLRSGGIHQPQYLVEKLTKLTGKDWRYLFSKAIPYQGGAFGNAILSSLPMQEELNFSLSMPGQKAEERTFLFASLTMTAGSQMGFGAFHLSVENESLRLYEIAQIKKALERFRSHLPFVLGGDLNSQRESETFHAMINHAFILEDLGPLEGHSFFSTKSDYKARIDFLLGQGLKAWSARIVEIGETTDHHLLSLDCKI